MPDNISLQIKNKQVLDNFISYTVESDLFVAGDAFEIVLADSDVKIEHGDRIKLFVNNQLELTAIANRPRRAYSKDESTVTVSGVDMMGLLTGHYLDEDKSWPGYTTEEIFNELLALVPFIDKNVQIHEGAKNAKQPGEKKASQYASSSKVAFRTQAGETVFSALKRFAVSKGLIFFNLPDGTFVLGRPVTSGRALYQLDRTNIKSMEQVDDAGQGFSSVKLVGGMQVAAGKTFGLANIRAEGNAVDEDFPYTKPFVAAVEEGESSLDLNRQAGMLIAQHKFLSSALIYTTAGHSWRGKTWQVNNIVEVQDGKYPDLNGNYPIYGRTFALTKDEGATTILKISRLGLLPQA